MRLAAALLFITSIQEHWARLPEALQRERAGFARVQDGDKTAKTSREPLAPFSDNPFAKSSVREEDQK
jgi:hypothetical protein